MTSTNVNVGLDADSRMTSRVLKPPGGGHTDIFGACDPEPPKPRKQTAAANIIGTENANVEKPTNGATDANENKTATAPAAETKQAEPAEAPKVEPPRRVRVPPGGFSSGLW